MIEFMTDYTLDEAERFARDFGNCSLVFFWYCIGCGNIHTAFSCGRGALLGVLGGFLSPCAAGGGSDVVESGKFKHFRSGSSALPP